MIQSFGQITLNDAAFKFYGDAVIDVRTLKADTSLLHLKINQKDSLLAIRVEQIEEQKYLNTTQKLISKNYKSDLKDCGDKIESKIKWNKIYKKVILTTVSVMILEGLLIYTLVK